MEYVLCSPAASPRLPSPPAAADHSHSPREPEEGLRLPPPPPPPLPPPPALGSSRPERLLDRLARGDARPGESARPRRRFSPGAGRGGGGGGRGCHCRRRSPPRRSPSPAPAKRPCRGSSGDKGKPSGDWDRYARSRSCSPDRPHSGYGATSNGQENTQRVGLMTYKQFCQVLEDDVSPAQARDRYQEYRTEYIATQKRAYFKVNKNEDWLKDMYHPTNLLPVIERRNDICKTVAKNVFLDLLSGTLDLGPGVTAGTASKSENGNSGSSEDDADYGGKKRMHGRVPRKDIELLSPAPKAHPVSSRYRRIRIDIERTLDLMKKLDSEKDIVDNIILTGEHDKSNTGSTGPVVIVRGLNTVKGLEGVELLDTLLTYLWRVHGVDYYGMSEMKYAKGFRHVRAENKSDSTGNIDAADWEKKLDSFWEERLMNGEDPLAVLTAKDKIDAAIVEGLEGYVIKMKDEKFVWKYGCGSKGCEKLFHAPEFVHKHLRLKHPDLVSVLTSRVEDDIYFQNYMNDPDAPGGAPVMQQSVPDVMRRKHDEQMVCVSGGPRSYVPVVPECAPSLVLVPVPGAGPYGPFVPAPPEIAMEVMQEGLRGPDDARRKKASVPGPFLPMYPSLPLDRRIYRSYQDLDAPKEEIAIFDYRSL